MLAIADRDVVEAVRFVRDHACDPGIEIEDILASLSFSRKTLDRWFRRWLGRSPHAEIARVRLARVQELLTTSSLPLEQIAPLAGSLTSARCAAW